MRVRIAIDARPDGTSLQDLRDYTALQVFSPTALPLLARGAHAPAWLGAIAMTVSPDLREYSFTLARHRWSDGSVVTGADYARGLAAVLRNRRAPWWTLLSHVEGFDSSRSIPSGISYTDATLSLRLGAADSMLPEVLSCPSFSPLHRSGDPHQSAGAYLLESQTVESVCLRANPFFIGCYPGGTGVVDQIVYVVCSEPRLGIDWYRDGVIDMTCDTSFPYDQVASHVSRDDFHLEARSGLLMALEVQPPPAAALDSAVARRWLTSVNRRRVVDELHSVLTPRTSLYRDLPSTQSLEERYERAGSTKVRLGYHPYYPNKIVLDSLALDWGSSGHTCETVLEDYYGRPKADACLLIHYDYTATPLSAYIRHLFLLARALSPRLTEYSACYLAFRAAADASVRDSHARKLDDIVRDEALLVPLFEIPRAFLRSPRLLHADFLPGRQMVRSRVSHVARSHV